MSTITPQIKDPDSDNLEKYIAQWGDANKRFQDDLNSLTALITQMMALLKGGKVSEAFQIAEMGVMPGAMSLQGDSMGQLAATMNVSSALQKFTTDTQNDLNQGANIDHEIPKGSDHETYADQFVQFLKDLYAKVNVDNPPDWLKNIQGGLKQSIEQICQVFGASDPTNLYPTTVANDVKTWINNPSTVDGNGKTGQQNIQNLQSGFTQWNNTESAQSQGLQAQEQFASNVYNQYMSSCSNIFHAVQQLSQAMVQNEKSQ